MCVCVNVSLGFSGARSTRWRTAAGQKTTVTAPTVATPQSTATRKPGPASSAPRRQTTPAWTWTMPQRMAAEETWRWMGRARSSWSSARTPHSWKRRTQPRPGELLVLSPHQSGLVGRKPHAKTPKPSNAFSHKCQGRYTFTRYRRLIANQKMSG